MKKVTKGLGFFLSFFTTSRKGKSSDCMIQSYQQHKAGSPEAVKGLARLQKGYYITVVLG